MYRVRVSFTSIRGVARRVEASVRAICLRLYLLYSVACQPIYIGLDSAFTSRATGTRPEEHRRAARFSHDKCAINFCETAPSRPARFMRARTLSVLLHGGVTSFVHVALVKWDAAFLHKGAIVISRNLENTYLDG